jgi:hypothetical protein
MFWVVLKQVFFLGTVLGLAKTGGFFYDKKKKQRKKEIAGSPPFSGG